MSWPGLLVTATGFLRTRLSSSLFETPLLLLLLHPGGRPRDHLLEQDLLRLHSRAERRQTLAP